MSATRRIFAMGGGGFTMEPENPAMERYVRSLLDEPVPRVCLLPTASGDQRDLVIGFHSAFDGLGCELSHVSLFRLPSSPLAVREHLLSQHAIYVAGGSMVNLLAVWRAHGLDRVLREAWESGVLLFGVSAGSLCWFEEGITKGSGECGRATGLGFLPGSNCVHYHGEGDRRPAYLRAVASGMPPGYGVDDGCGLLFEDTELSQVVGSRPDARAYRVERRGQEVQEFPLEPTYLPAAEDRPAAPSPDIAELRSLRAQRASGVGNRRRRVSLLD